MTIYLGENLLAGSFKSGASWEVGDIGQAALGIDESLNKRRYLNGQVISQTQFAQFTAWLKQRVSLYPSLAISEADWQTAVTNSDLGQCGQFVIDDVNSTIRLPKVVNLQGLMDLTHLGETVEAGLPNIEGSLGSSSGSNYWSSYNTTSQNGALKSEYNGSNGYVPSSAGGSGNKNKLVFDASLSNSIYGNSTTVQPESVQYPYFIQVAEGIENSVDVSREIELSNPFSLLDYKFSEYEITNASWLRSNGQFNLGTTYADVYNLLLQIYNGTVTKAGVSVKLSTETYADTDFVLNTSDTTFRLPTKVALASGKAVAGNGKALVLTDGTNNYGVFGSSNNDTIKQNINVANQDVGATPTDTGGYAQYKVLGLAENSNAETSANGLYLYFYVGAVVQDASVIAVASVLTQIAELLSCDYVVESKTPTAEDPSWYRVYKSGWVEQGGLTSASAAPSGYITLLVEMRDTNYFCLSNYQSNDTGGARTNYSYCGAYSTTQILVGAYSTNNKNSWEVKGFKK